MKAKTLQKASAIAALAVASIPAIFAIPNNKTVYADEMDSGVSSWSVEDCYSFMSEMPYELNDFVRDYNSVVDEDNYLNAQSIEYSDIVYIEDIENYGVYFDFDGDNGYAVITPKKTIYGLNTDYDLDYLKTCDDLHYSSVDGFLYRDDEGVLQRFDVPNHENEESDLVAINIASSGKKFPGQDEAGDGQILTEKIYEYVAARYPQLKYVRSSGRTQSKSDWTIQYETSYYRMLYADKNGNYTIDGCSEGNCALNAMYNMFIDWGRRKLVDTPYQETDNIVDRIKSDSLYSIYGVGMPSVDAWQGSFKKCAWKVNESARLMNMPVVYSNIRDYAMGKGYTINGYNNSDVPSTLEFVANTVYGNNIDVQYTTSASEAMKYVLQNKATYLSINGSMTYKNHGVVVIGYYLYEWEISVGSYSAKINYYFYEVADGWNAYSKVFDPYVMKDIELAFCYLARC